MLGQVVAEEYVREMIAGRNCPLLVNCEKQDGTIVPVVAKFSGFDATSAFKVKAERPLRLEEGGY